MSKGVTVERCGLLLQILFKILKENQEEGIQARDAIQKVSEKIALTDHEKGNYANGDQRFPKILRFATVDVVKAGWLVKDKGGIWFITEEGLNALEKYKDPVEFYSAAKKLYNDWRREQPKEIFAEEATNSADADLAESATVTLEEAEEQAWAEIIRYLEKIDPYKLQDLIAAVLEAMGYYIDWIAPPGPDGGIDIIAGLDPLGTKPPRIKVQVKRKAATVTPEEYRAFASLIHSGEVGIFVNIGGFTKPIMEEARKDTQRRIKLINARELVDLWIDNFEKIEQSKRQLLPFKTVHFLDIK